MTVVPGKSAGGLVLAVIGLAFGMLGSAGQAAAQVAPGVGAAGDEMTPRLELMLRSMRIARDWHVSRPGRPELIAGAIQGLLQKVDSEAEIYSRADLRRLLAAELPDRAGVGLEVRREPPARRQTSRGYRVISSRDGSPAALAGLKAGDLLTHINGRPAGEMSHLDVTREELGGAAGTAVGLTVERDGMATVTLDLVRSPVVAGPPPVTLSEPAPGIVLIRIAALEAPGASDLERELMFYRERLGSGQRGIVLDLRGTAGGSVGEAVGIADAFLDDGVIMASEARSPREKASRAATSGDQGSGRPLVVLIDGGTAGPAEVLAAALKENQRARLIGVKSAGRGLVRTLRGLGRKGEKGALRLATSRLLTPSGRQIEGVGVTPDVGLEQAPADPLCRSLDISEKGIAGRCVRRSRAEDAQLERALGLLDEQVAAGSLPATGRP